jgi:hypothetical protein
MLLAATGDDRLDPSLANLLAVFVMVVAAIGVERIRRPLTALATRLTLIHEEGRTGRCSRVLTDGR